MFNDHELELLISGLPEIDVDDLRANTDYHGYSPASPVIQYFWEVVREMDKEDLALLVQFVTGTSKVPLEGFKALQVRCPCSALRAVCCVRFALVVAACRNVALCSASALVWSVHARVRSMQRRDSTCLIPPPA